MYKVLSLAVLIALVACKKENKAPASSETGSAAPSAGSGSAAATPPSAPPAPPPAPVTMTAEQLKPTCAKIFTAEVAAKTHGATAVEQKGAPGVGPLAICELKKGDEVVGSATIACKPDLDVTLIERERAAMTKATDMPAGIGRGGYRVSNAFFFNDDETPCRINANWVTVPEGDALADALRAITAAINPTTLQ
jgi:hypothetical protein